MHNVFFGCWVAFVEKIEDCYVPRCAATQAMACEVNDTVYASTFNVLTNLLVPNFEFMVTTVRYFEDQLHGARTHILRVRTRP